MMTTPPDVPLTCANGAPWGPPGCGPCAGCLAESNRLAADFWHGYSFGAWDETGRKPSEQRALARQRLDTPRLTRVYSEDAGGEV